MSYLLGGKIYANKKNIGLSNIVAFSEIGGLISSIDSEGKINVHVLGGTLLSSGESDIVDAEQIFAHSTGIAVVSKSRGLFNFWIAEEKLTLGCSIPGVKKAAASNYGGFGKILLLKNDGSLEMCEDKRYDGNLSTEFVSSGPFVDIAKCKGNAIYLMSENSRLFQTFDLNVIHATQFNEQIRFLGESSMCTENGDIYALYEKKQPKLVARCENAVSCYRKNSDTYVTAKDGKVYHIQKVWLTYGTLSEN